MFVELTACRHLVVGSAYLVDEGWMKLDPHGAGLVGVGRDSASVLTTPAPAGSRGCRGLGFCSPLSQIGAGALTPLPEGFKGQSLVACLQPLGN